MVTQKKSIATQLAMECFWLPFMWQQKTFDHQQGWQLKKFKYHRCRNPTLREV
jgi:hypothetical protein